MGSSGPAIVPPNSFANLSIVTRAFQLIDQVSYILKKRKAPQHWPQGTKKPEPTSPGSSVSTSVGALAVCDIVAASCASNRHGETLSDMCKTVKSVD